MRIYKVEKIDTRAKNRDAVCALIDNVHDYAETCCHNSHPPSLDPISSAISYIRTYSSLNSSSFDAFLINMRADVCVLEVNSCTLLLTFLT